MQLMLAADDHFSSVEFSSALSQTEALAEAVRAAAVQVAGDDAAAPEAPSQRAAIKTASSRLLCAVTALSGPRPSESVGGAAASAGSSGGGSGSSCLCSGGSVAALPALRGGLACVRLLRAACALGPALAEAAVSGGGLAAALALLDFLGRDGELRGDGEDDEKMEASGCGDSSDWPKCVAKA